MQPFENMKVFNAIPPGVIKDNAAFVSNVIDLGVPGGGQSLVFSIALGATDVPVAVCKVMQSDVQTNGTTLGGTPDQVVNVLSTVVPGAGDDNAMLIVEVDLKGPHKRYMQLQVTAGNGTAGTYLSAQAFLTNVGVPPTNSGALAYINA